MEKPSKQKFNKDSLKAAEKAPSLRFFTLDYPIKYQGIINYSFLSRGTLIDADIVVIDPEQVAEKALAENHEYGDGYQGKPILYESYSHLVAETIERRKNELQILLENGKTIFVFLKPTYEVNIITSVTKEFKGSKAINMRNVSTISNYSYLPIIPQFIEGTGSAIDLNTKSPYYSILKPIQSLLFYEAYFSTTPQNGTTFAVTPATRNSVGVVIPIRKGQIIFLPTISSPITAGRLVNFFISFTKTLSQKGSLTTPPEWVNGYTVPGEKEQGETIVRLGEDIAKLNLQLEKEKERLEKIQSWRRLLFEQGTPLADVVKGAFGLLGFTVSDFQNSSQEHDIILEADGKRALGEIEGKDSKPINVDKFRQLSTNLDEDFERAGKYAKGILIGNGYRLNDPASRTPQFTEKVMEGVKAKSFVVISTDELYRATIYALKNSSDEVFKKQCRDKIFDTIGGLVKFDIPAAD